MTPQLQPVSLTSFPHLYSCLPTARSISRTLFNVFDYLPHTSQTSFDPISVHVPLKIKQKIWEGRFIKLSILPKSARDLAEDELHGQIQIRNGTIGAWLKTSLAHSCSSRSKRQRSLFSWALWWKYTALERGDLLTTCETYVCHFYLIHVVFKNILFNDWLLWL